MKRLLTTGIAFTLVLAMLAGCGGTQAPSSTPGAEASTSSSSASQSTSSIPEASSIPEIATAPKAKLIGSNLYTYVAPFTNGYAFVSNGTEWGYVDTQGKYTPSTASPETVHYQDFVDYEYVDYENEAEMLKDNPNRLFVSEEGLYPYCETDAEGLTLWGFMNIKTGEVAIPAKYSSYEVFNNGRAVVTTYTEVGGKSSPDSPIQSSGGSTIENTYIIDTTGKVIKEIGDAAQPYYKSGIFMAREARPVEGRLESPNDVLVMDLNGKELFRMATETIPSIEVRYGQSPFSGEFMDVMDVAEGQPMYRRKADGSFCVMNADGSVAFEPPVGAVDVSDFYNNLSFAKNSDKLYAMVDNKGTLLTDYKFINFMRFSAPEYTIVEEADIGWYPIDNTGKRMGETTFDSHCNYPQSGFMTGGRAGKYGAIDPTTGEEFLPFIYDDLSVMVNGMVWVKEGDTWSLCNLKGEKQDFMTATDVTYIEEDSFAIAVEGGLQIVTIA